MNVRIIAMAAALVAGAPAAQAASEAAGTCAVSIDFGSFCCGIDREAYDKVKAFAEESPLVAGQSERTYGMEGERVVCLSAKTAGDAKAIHAELQRRIGGKAGRGPVKMRVGTGE